MSTIVKNTKQLQTKDQSWEEKIKSGRAKLKEQKRLEEETARARERARLREEAEADQRAVQARRALARRIELRDPASDYWQTVCGGFARAAKLDPHHLVQIRTYPREVIECDSNYYFELNFGG